MKLAHSRSLPFRLAAFASAAVLAAGFAVLASAGSASAATCSGYSCHGLDPEIYGCSATSTITVPVRYDGVQVATLWNRYSSRCNANWARGQLTTAGLSAHDTFGITVTTTDNQGYEFMCYPGADNLGVIDEYYFCYGLPAYGGTQILYTDMVDGTKKTTAVIYVYNSSGSFLASTYLMTDSASQ
jgi:hypothetical protein